MGYEAILNEVDRNSFDSCNYDELYYTGKLSHTGNGELKTEIKIALTKLEIDLQNIKSVSGIFERDEDMKNYINSLIPGSFGLRIEFILKSPYFSRDNDELYIVQNPVLKEYTTKVPMIKGSGWKGYLSSTALKMLAEKVENDDSSISDMIKFYLSYIRIFGTGSEDFRKLEEMITKYIENNHDNQDKQKLTNALIKYCLYDLGINIRISKNGTSIEEQLVEQIREKEKSVVEIFSVSKGRGIFYPTYFNKISYEVINPQNEKKRKGTFPIFYEVVPSGAEGIFQFIYVPFNGILKDKKALKKEVEEDKRFLEEVFKYCLEQTGIGAKSKLGWGLGTLRKPIEFFESKMEV